ncbi:MAG TPA: Z1 domain-containing protein [Candidatus Angelobacter sp.]|nr:Z1 domain-containing protein [Candidatus Angelobacter sp.]
MASQPIQSQSPETKEQVNLELNGTFYYGFLQKMRDGVPVYGPDEQQCVQDTVSELLAQSTTATKPGMLLGKIQSGKTKTFLGIIALAFDNGYDVAIILTKPTTALAKQTYKRVSKDFADFIEGDQAKLYDILEMPERLTQFELNQKIVFIVKKQTDNLERLAEAILDTYPQMASKRILIVDDEADNASIGYVNDKTTGLQLRAIAKQIDEFRRKLAVASFLQVTATPYSLYLQPENSPISGANLAPVRPKFTKLVPVHPSYVGGKFYFEDSKIPQDPAAYVFVPVSRDELAILRSEDRRKFKVEDCLTSDRISGLRAAILSFIVGGCMRRIQDEQARKRPKRFAFLFHTEAQKAAHAWQESVILRIEEKLQEEARNRSALLQQLVRDAYDDLSRSTVAAQLPLPAFEEVFGRVTAALTGGELMITKVNSEAQVSALLDDEGQLRLRNPLNIFIGGQILDRGITISNLIGFYYGRDPQRFQQDTVLQHSRMYGFRPIEDRAVTRFYTSPHIRRAMERMHEADSALRERIARNGDQTVNFIELDPQGVIVPCNPAKILASNITTLQAHRRILPVGFQTDFKTRLFPITTKIDQKLRALGPFPSDGESPDPFSVSIVDAIELIEHLGPTFIDFAPGYEDRWDPEEYKAILRHMSESSTNADVRGRVFVLVRTGRNLSRLVKRGSHAEFSDAPDTTRTEGSIARRFAQDIPVLMMIRENGTAEGWRDCPFWWPVIVPPANMRTTLFARPA